MKKIILLSSVFVFMAMFCSGCISGYSISEGLPRTLPGLVSANQKSGGYIAPKVESMKDMKVLGPVSAELQAKQIIMLISEGDISIAAAKEIALRKYPDADDIVNIEIDVRHESILGLYNTVTMYFRGIAVKYDR